MDDHPTVLVLNAGSATLKYRLVRHPEHMVARGRIEHIGETGGPAGHTEAFAAAMAALAPALARHPPAAVGHRVVHGGEHLRAPVRLDPRVEALIAEAAPLAPIHNQAALSVITAARATLADAAHVAVFDTAFHTTLPAAASTYPLDAEVARRHGIRRYGFHGISVEYVRDRAAALLDRPARALNMIVLHLGNGASATALAAGVSIDTTMGLTPLEGLVMGTRCGSIDPAITFHLARAGWTLAEIEDLYEYRSGLAGLCGDNDVRAVTTRANRGDPAAITALDVYCHRVRASVGALYAQLGHLDAVVFTGGVGEHSALVRSRALAGLGELGIAVDEVRNGRDGTDRLISPTGGRVAVCVVATDEEQAIAGHVVALLRGRSGA